MQYSFHVCLDYTKGNRRQTKVEPSCRLSVPWIGVRVRSPEATRERDGVFRTRDIPGTHTHTSYKVPVRLEDGFRHLSFDFIPCSMFHILHSTLTATLYCTVVYLTAFHYDDFILIELARSQSRPSTKVRFRRT